MLGAAGGLGFAFLSYLPNVELQSGIHIVLEAVGLEQDIRDADWVLTGEAAWILRLPWGKLPWA